MPAPIERLESRGLVERQPTVHDRRVRAVRLTRAGVRMRERLVRCLVDGHPAVAGLAPHEQERLRDLLRRLDL